MNRLSYGRCWVSFSSVHDLFSFGNKSQDQNPSVQQTAATATKNNSKGKGGWERAGGGGSESVYMG